jgi:hypothetical protein
VIQKYPFDFPLSILVDADTAPRKLRHELEGSTGSIRWSRHRQDQVTWHFIANQAFQYLLELLGFDIWITARMVTPVHMGIDVGHICHCTVFTGLPARGAYGVQWQMGSSITAESG